MDSAYAPPAKVSTVKKIAIINGPNLNKLGEREPSVYGQDTLEGINEWLALESSTLEVELSFFQSNVEGEIVTALHQFDSSDGIVLNAGGYTHYSIAIRDAISAISAPVVEVHLSNVYAREDFRHISAIAPVCKGSISGFGKNSYLLAIRSLT
ncbi:MAG: type II 3-dehydroquinate dehydratase [Clostridiales Family XIII bacterium]|jgi:3-dehydroquinate dehydratase-2|nr:type II 3-dehydroquinate dehydratase [Clostridiales Family XIII bacterium]